MGKMKRDADPDLIGLVWEYDEDALARVIGLQRKYIQAARGRMQEGVCWVLKAGAVVYSREGVTRLLSELGMVQGEAWVEELLKTARVGEAWEKERTGLRRVRVTLLPLNRRLVLANLLDDPDRTVRVIVGDSAAYARGMELSVRLAQEPDLYEIVKR
jgi:hypothetical protein